jgi:hypothetical protein
VHAPGDIWADLPTHGLLKCKRCAGIVITPACDLANQKVETLTYLPVVPISHWFSCTGALTEIQNQARPLSTQLEIGDNESKVLTSRLPDGVEIEKFEAVVKAKIGDGKTQKINQLVERLLACTSQIKLITRESFGLTEMPKLQQICGEKQFSQIIKKIICNSYRSDLHYLPSDGEDEEWSAIPRHAVALFRYPLTAPIELFDLSQDLSIHDWDAAIGQHVGRIPFAEAFREKKPLKTLTLLKDFLSDLLTRFVSLYVRLGSPDFNEHTVDTLQRQIADEPR